MAAAPARALATDKRSLLSTDRRSLLSTDRRWATVAAAPKRSSGEGVLGMAPKPSNMPTQRDYSKWGSKPGPPAPNVLGSSLLLSLSNDEGSGSLVNINVCPASGASSSASSTSGSDLLDSPLACCQNSDPLSTSNVLASHNSATGISRPQETGSRSGSSMQHSLFQVSFSEALKAPPRSIAKWGPTSHGKGFTISADDFPVLVSKIPESESQLGHSSQGQPTFGSSIVDTQYEERKNLIAGGDPVPNTNLAVKAEKAQYSHVQDSNICMPPPWIDHWNPPPDHPPDSWRKGAASYGRHKPGNTPGTGSLPVDFPIHNDQTLLNQEGEASLPGQVHGGYHPEKRDSCYPHVPTDACVKILHHLILGKVKDSHSVTLQEQPVIKKDLVLLEKIRQLNIKARNLRACNISQISSCMESKAEHRINIDVKTDQVAKDVASFDLANFVSEHNNLVLNGPSNVTADCVDLSEGHVTESSDHKKLGKSTDYHVQEAKYMEKLEEMNSHSYAHSRNSYNAPIEANKIGKQKAESSSIADQDTSASDSCFIRYAENLNVPLTANGIKNAAVSISSAPSDTAGVSRGPLNHCITPSANKTDINIVEQIAQKNAAQSNGTIVQKLLPMEIRQRQIHLQNRILRERSNNAESSKHTRNVAGTLMETRRSEGKPHLNHSIKNENKRPVSANPNVVNSENSEASSVHKSQKSGVVINSPIIPMQVASVSGFTVGSIMLGDASLAASVNHEEKTVVKKVQGEINGCESPQQTQLSGKHNHGVQLVKGAHWNDSVMLTPAKKPSKKSQSEIGGLNHTTIPTPTRSSGDHSTVQENLVRTKMSKMVKPACEEQHLPNLGPVAMAEGHTSGNNSSTFKLEGEPRGKEALDSCTARNNEVQTEAVNSEDRVPERMNETSMHSGRSSSFGNKVSTNGLSPVGLKLTGEGENSPLINVMQELSDISQQVESKTLVATEYRAQRTQAGLLPDSENPRQHLVKGQEGLQSTYVNRTGTMHDIHMGTTLPTAQLLPLPQLFPRLQVDALVNGIPGWTWDVSEGILLSDVENFRGLGTATVDKSSSAALTQNVFNLGTVDLHGGQVVGDMVYQAATPGILYHTGLEHQQFSPAWHLLAQNDAGMNNGTGVYWPMMQQDTGMIQAQGVNHTANPMGGLMPVEYQMVEPVASPSSATYDWSQLHLGSNLTTPLQAHMGRYL